MPFIITGMKWDRCESQLCFVLLWLPPTTLMFLQCRTGPGFFSILKFSPMTVCIFQASRIAEDKCHDLPLSLIMSFVPSWGIWEERYHQKLRRWKEDGNGGTGEGWLQSFVCSASPDNPKQQDLMPEQSLCPFVPWRSLEEHAESSSAQCSQEM